MQPVHRFGVRAGGKPVFFDCLEETWHLDPEVFETKGFWASRAGVVEEEQRAVVGD